MSFLCGAQEKPKLVVGIVVDQMRQEYLWRFSDKFSEGGFRRLMQNGFQFKNAHYNYTPTYTAPGHASIYTGTTPSKHGIIANNWYDREMGRSTYCVSDSNVGNVGGTTSSGKMSPKNLTATTITDELLLTSNFRAKVVGISIKDRGSILPAGHNPTGSYWFDGKNGDFMTSTYYMDELPQWVQEFNQKKFPATYLKETWNTLLPINQYVESTADNVLHERPLKGKETATFPYELNELVKQNGIGLIRTTPYGNRLVMDMAIAALDGEALGADDITDFLAISFSSTDYVGHQFGPNSIELEDTYLRLDKEIERLLKILDKRYGEDYLIFLSSDHGVVPVPSFLEQVKMPGGYLDQKSFDGPFQERVETLLGSANWIEDVSNDQVFLNHPLISAKGFDKEEISIKVKNLLLAMDEIETAYTYNDLVARNGTDAHKKRIENGFHDKRSGDVAFKLKSGFYVNGYGKQGTTHGSGYNYDTHVPMLFYGAGIKKGSSVRPVSITDIAPTLSMLLNVSLPSAATGIPLKELFE